MATDWLVLLKYAKCFVGVLISCLSSHGGLLRDCVVSVFCLDLIKYGEKITLFFKLSNYYFENYSHRKIDLFLNNFTIHSPVIIPSLNGTSRYSLAEYREDLWQCWNQIKVHFPKFVVLVQIFPIPNASFSSSLKIRSWGNNRAFFYSWKLDKKLPVHNNLIYVHRLKSGYSLHLLLICVFPEWLLVKFGNKVWQLLFFCTLFHCCHCLAQVHNSVFLNIYYVVSSGQT